VIGVEHLPPARQFVCWFSQATPPRTPDARTLRAGLVVVNATDYSCKPARGPSFDADHHTGRHERRNESSSPAESPKRGWLDVCNSYRAMAEQNMSLAATGIAFFIVWALFPALATLVVFGALLVGRSRCCVALIGPRGPARRIQSHRRRAARFHCQRSRGLSIVTVLGALAFSLSTPYAAMPSKPPLPSPFHGSRKEPPLSTFQQEGDARVLLSSMTTPLLAGSIWLGGLVGLAGAVSRSATDPALLAPSRWPILIVAMMLLLSFAYRYGPCRKVAQWRWVTWGATASATIWVAGSSLLSYYAAHVTHLNPLLGSLGSVVLFLFWSYLTVLAILSVRRSTPSSSGTRHATRARTIHNAGRCDHEVQSSRRGLAAFGVATNIDANDVATGYRSAARATRTPQPRRLLSERV
jgi:membrane protein